LTFRYGTDKFVCADLDQIGTRWVEPHDGVLDTEDWKRWSHIERLPMLTSPIRRAAARQWAVLMAIIVVVLVVSGVYRLHGIFGSQDQTSRPSADSLGNTGFDPKRVYLQVLGDPGARATINFLDEHAQPQRVDDAPLPWSHELVTEDTTLFADVRAQGDSSSITCRITVNGIVKDERSSDDVNGYIACLDKTA
jgi:Mycobacterium membrane protein